VDDTTDDAKAAAQAKDVLARIKSGGDFAALAKEFSKDTASAEQGGDLAGPAAMCTRASPMNSRTACSR
jgi:parvulin-like peptidyl-prolyl isomerase